MRSTILFCLTILSLNVAASVLSELLPYRSYYFIRNLSEESHQFTVWLEDGEGYTKCYVSVKNQKDIQGLSFSSLRETVSPVDLKPTAFDFNAYIPDKEVRTIIALLRDQVPILLPGATPFHIVYRGFFKEIRVDEVIAFDAPGLEQRRGIRSSQDYKVTDRGIEPSSAVSLAQPLGHDQDLLNKTSLIDYVLPPHIEGSSLFSTSDIGTHEDHIASRLHLLDAIFESSYLKTNLDDQFAKIKARQGSELVHPQLKQMFIFTMHLTGYSRDSTEEVRKTVTLAVSSQEILSNYIGQIHQVPELEVEIAITGGQGDFRIKVSQAETHDLAEYNLHLGFVPLMGQTQSAAIIYGPVNLISKDNSPVRNEFQVSGNHHFRLINVEVETKLKPALKTGFVFDDECHTALVATKKDSTYNVHYLSPRE